MKRSLAVSSLLACLAACIGCSQTAGSAAGSSGANTPSETVRNYPYQIVTTCGMVTDIVRVVVGDRARVTGLMGEGVDPHLYKPTRNDVKQLIGADVVFYSGLMLEGRMADTFAKVARYGNRMNGCRFAVTSPSNEQKSQAEQSNRCQ